MSESELRAAANDVREIMSRWGKDAGMDDGIRLCHAAQELADAFPADDDEPVTAEWLESVGFVSDRDGAPTYSLELHGRRGGPVAWLSWTPHMGCDAWSVGASPHAPDTLLPNNLDTRGDVRRLLRALGAA